MTAPGSLSTGSPAGPTPPHGDGSMYSQVNVRAGKCAAAPHRESASGGKVIVPGVRFESRTGELVRSPQITRGRSIC